MTTVITIFIIIYAVSLAFMTIVITIAKAWDEDKNYVTLAVFAPVINTLVFCIGSFLNCNKNFRISTTIFYVVPTDIYKRHKDKEKLKHKHDPRWNLMNNRENE